MTSSRHVNIPRLIRLATFGGAVLAGALAYLTNEPTRDAYAARLDDALAQLRSDDVISAETTHLRAERDALRRRYARLFAGNAEAIFLRELDRNIRRRGVALISTVVRRDGAPQARQPGDFGRIALTLELRGRYRALLETVADLSQGKEIVTVDPPNFRRDGMSLVASIPVVVFTPTANEARVTASRPFTK